MKNARAGLLVMAFCTLASTMSHAQDFPRRAITLILPFSAGGVTDQVARLVAAKVADNIGNPVVVENRPGGGGQIAAGVVKQAQPDGYTLLVGDIGTHAINASLYNRLTYDPLKDFVPVVELVEMPHVLVVPSDSPFKTMGDLIAGAQGKPRSPNLRLGRGRQRCTPPRRNAQVRSQYRCCPCSLSRIDADCARPNVEPGRALFRRGGKHGATHPGRKTARLDGDG